MVREKKTAVEAAPAKKSELTFRKGIAKEDVSITSEAGIATMRFKCTMDGGKTQIAEVAAKYRPHLRIDFQSVDGKYNLSLRNGTVNVSNASEGDVIEVDQSWPVGRAAGRIGDGITWLLRGSTITISGKGKMPDFDDVKDTPWYIFRSNVKSVEVKGDVASIGRRAFNKFKNLTDANLGNATIVGNRAFAGCASLENVSMDAVQAVNASAFSDCTSLKTLRFGSKLKKLDKSVFSGCTSLKSVVFNGETMPSMDPTSFAGCADVAVTSKFDRDELTGAMACAVPDDKTILQIYVEEVPGSEGQHDYSYAVRSSLAVKAADVRGNMYELTDEYSLEPPFIGVKSSVNLKISYCGITALVKTTPMPRTSGSDVVDWKFDEADGSLSIFGNAPMPNYDAIERAPWYLFGDHIREVRISKGVPRIGKRAFDGCDKLKIVHADDVTDVGDYAFRNCTSLDCIHLGSVKVIGSLAFQGCIALVFAYLGPGLAKIGRHAFENCKELEILRMDCETAPALGEACLQGIPEGFIIISKLDDGWADGATDGSIIYKKS